MARFLLAALLILSALAGEKSLAGDLLEADCLAEAANRLKQGDSLIIEHGFENPIGGKLHSINLQADSLTIARQMGQEIQLIGFSGHEISSISFKKPGKFRPKYALMGAAIGATPGLIVSIIGHIDSNNDFTTPPLNGTGSFECGTDLDQTKIIGAALTVVGGVVGLLVGSILGTELPSDQRIDCEF